MPSFSGVLQSIAAGRLETDGMPRLVKRLAASFNKGRDKRCPSQHPGDGFVL